MTIENYYAETSFSIIDCFDNHVDSMNNFRKGPIPPKKYYLQITSLSCSMDAHGIDSETPLWSKIKSDYPNDFPI